MKKKLLVAAIALALIVPLVVILTPTPKNTISKTLDQYRCQVVYYHYDDAGNYVAECTEVENSEESTAAIVAAMKDANQKWRTGKDYTFEVGKDCSQP